MKRKAKPSKIKEEYLKLLEGNVLHFYPSKKGHFLCPVCLKFFSFDNKSKISIAHIIPKYAKGDLKTLLCKKCNSDLGRKQDKWFGEFIRLQKEKKSPLGTTIKPNYFHIDDLKFNGSFEQKSDGSLAIIINNKVNSPKTNSLVKNYFKKGLRNKHRLQLKLPILGEQRNVKVGYLTAAYLLFFATFGYSWVLQSHLSKLREQILNPDKDILTDSFFLKCDGIQDDYWLGVISVNGKYVLAAGFYGFAVILPSVTETNIYDQFQSMSNGLDSKHTIKAGFYPMIFINKHFYDAPVCLVYENKLLFSPDAYIERHIEAVTIYFSNKYQKAKFLFPTPDHEFEALKKQSDSEVVEINARGNVSTDMHLHEFTN